MAKGNTIRKERKARVSINASRPRTRGQRGKLHDPATNTAELTAQLRAMGLYAAPTLGDGNCLFRALSDQIYGTPNEHLVLRKEICAFMAGHKERFEAFVDDDRSWDQHISAMRNNGTYGGHLELTAFAQLKTVNVKVVQPGLVYVIEGGRTDTFGPSTSTSIAPEDEGPANSRDKRKAKKERMKKKAAEKVADEDYDDEDDEGGSSPFPGTVYVAYHDWEHFSSVRNLIGPHQGMPNVCEVPEPDTSSLPSPPSSQAATKRGGKQKAQLQSAKQTPISRQQSHSRPPTPSDSLSPPPSRSPKRAMDEDDEEEDENETRKRNRRGTITVTPPDEEQEDDGESEFAAGISSSVSAESGSFISDAPPPPPPGPEPEPEPEPEPASKLTKRQRKSLGVPKARSSTQQRGRRSVGSVAANKGRASIASTTSDTPKRETRSATKAYRDAGKVRDLGTGEWLDNGTGRLDVRGFRELRI